MTMDLALSTDGGMVDVGDVVYFEVGIDTVYVEHADGSESRFDNAELCGGSHS